MRHPLDNEPDKRRFRFSLGISSAIIALGTFVGYVAVFAFAAYVAVSSREIPVSDNVLTTLVLVFTCFNIVGILSGIAALFISGERKGFGIAGTAANTLILMILYLGPLGRLFI